MTTRLSKHGFSLVELMISGILLAFVMGGMYTTFLAGNLSWESYSATTRSQRQVRNALLFLSKDLRVSNISNFVQQSDSLSFQLAHPVDGTVTYAWTTTGGSANQVIRTRTSDSRTWIIAQDISVFTVTETSDDVIINLTASSQTIHGQDSDFQLAAKVAKR